MSNTKSNRPISMEEVDEALARLPRGLRRRLLEDYPVFVHPVAVENAVRRFGAGAAIAAVDTSMRGLCRQAYGPDHPGCEP